jgi:hypothetical protein
MPIINTFAVIEEGIFMALAGGDVANKEVQAKSEIGLRRFAQLLPTSFNGRLTIALFPDSQFSLRISAIGRWVCTFRFRDEVSCDYTANAEGCWARGAGTLEHVAAIIGVFGVPVRLVSDQ